jgi:hypothetical protein
MEGSTNTKMISELNSESQEESFHVLKNKWVLWAHLPHNTDWSPKSYVKVCELSTVEETIAIMTTLPKELVQNCMLFLMKKGIAPMWEDPQNRQGGCFSYKVLNKNVPEVWRESMYAMTGETISANQQFISCVTGFTSSPKRDFCIFKLWTSNCANQNPMVVTNEVNGIKPQGCIFKKHAPEF